MYSTKKVFDSIIWAWLLLEGGFYQRKQGIDNIRNIVHHMWNMKVSFLEYIFYIILEVENIRMDYYSSTYKWNAIEIINYPHSQLNDQN